MTTASALDGAGLLDTLEDLTCSMRDGDWLATSLAAVSLPIEVVAAALDPFGALVGAGLGWLMEHLEPLKGWLTDLTGDAAEVGSIAASWHDVGGHLDDAADDLTRMVRRDLELMSGASIDAYVRYTDDLALHLRGLGNASSAVGAALTVCSTVVQVVHDLVRDTLAQLVGSIVSWATEATLSLGIATPWIVSQVTTRVSALAARVGRSVADVVSSAKALKGLVDAVDEVLSRVTRRLRQPARSTAPDLAPAAEAGAGARSAPIAANPVADHLPAALDDVAPPRRTWPDDPEPGTWEHSLGFDPDVGKLRVSEYHTAIHIMEERSVHLERAQPGTRGDWFDADGVSYDAVGGFNGQHLRTPREWKNFLGQIDRHLGKADLVPVDVSGFSPAQIARVRAHVESLGDRVFIVGEQ
jgi:hypothetical protein